MEKQIAVISGLAEGMSIRGIERMAGVNQNTINVSRFEGWPRLRTHHG
jgi:hypothetical protein